MVEETMEYTKIRVPGNLVIMNWEARQRVREAFDEFFVEIDLSEAEIVDSAGMDLLTKLYRHLRAKNGLMKIINVDPIVRDTLNVCGVTNLMEIA